jgi:hypothetical protein
VRAALVLILAAYLFAWLLGGIPGLLTLAGLGIVGTGIFFLADTIHRWDQERQSRQRVSERFYPHRCPTCGILHGGVGERS